MLEYMSKQGQGSSLRSCTLNGYIVTENITT